MKNARVTTRVAVWLAVLGFCLPPPLLEAAPPISQPPVMIDVALSHGGLLHGQIVDSEGAAVANQSVSLQYDNQVIAAGMTDEDGAFSFQQVRGGVHQVVTADYVSTYRLWAPGTAPPAAQPGARVVAASYMAPGSMSGGGTWGRTRSFLSNPWVIAALVTTAIAVPVAIAVSNDKSPGSN